MKHETGNSSVNKMIAEDLVPSWHQVISNHQVTYISRYEFSLSTVVLLREDKTKEEPTETMV